MLVKWCQKKPSERPLMGSPKSLITIYMNTTETCTAFQNHICPTSTLSFFFLFGGIVICHLEDAAVAQGVHQQNEAAQFVLELPSSTVCWREMERSLNKL